jgi:hypothetical protein
MTLMSKKVTVQMLKATVSIEKQDLKPVHIKIPDKKQGRYLFVIQFWPMKEIHVKIFYNMEMKVIIFCKNPTRHDIFSVFAASV